MILESENVFRTEALKLCLDTNNVDDRNNFVTHFLLVFGTRLGHPGWRIEIKLGRVKFFLGDLLNIQVWWFWLCR